MKYRIEMNNINTYKYWNKAAEELLNKHFRYADMGYTHVDNKNHCV